MNTKEKIVEKALEMYNTYGIEYVGVRELAKELQMKGGNITYYFPTKGDLIAEITRRLSEDNSRIINEKQEMNMYNFLDMHRVLYHNQYKYRSIFISLALLLKQNLVFNERYRQTQVMRRKDIFDDLKMLLLKGHILGSKVDDLDIILGYIATLNRFWISEASLDMPDEDEEVVMSTYLLKLANMMKLVATEKGKRDIAQFISELQ